MKIKKSGSTEKTVYDIAKPLADELGLTIWDVCFVKEGAAWYLRVFIDKAEGITIDDCEALSRPMNKLLDELDPISQSYFFEVGSAGLERTLEREEHFDASLGKHVKVRLIIAEDGIKEFEGTLNGRSKEALDILTEDGSKTIGLEKIAHVKLVDDYEYEE